MRCDQADQPLFYFAYFGIMGEEIFLSEYEINPKETKGDPS